VGRGVGVGVGLRDIKRMGMEEFMGVGLGRYLFSWVVHYFYRTACVG
jgi:hypothetical protein